MVVPFRVPDVIKQVDPTFRVHRDEVNELGGENRDWCCFLDDSFRASDELADGGFNGRITLWVPADVTDETFRGFDVTGTSEVPSVGEHPLDLPHGFALSVTRFADIQDIEVRVKESIVCGETNLPPDRGCEADVCTPHMKHERSFVCRGVCEIVADERH